MTTEHLERLLVLLLVVPGPVAEASSWEPRGGRETVINSVVTNMSGAMWSCQSMGPCMSHIPARVASPV